MRTFASALLALCLFGCDTAGLKDAYMALDAQGNRRRTVFYTDTEAIYCVVEMASGVDDVTLVARLHAKAYYDEFTGRKRSGPDAVIAVEENAPGTGQDITVSYRIEKPEGSDYYPAGEFSCELLLDGKREESLSFDIRYPECPFEPFLEDDSCAGLVLRGAECPSAAGSTCICDLEQGVWRCP